MLCHLTLLYKHSVALKIVCHCIYLAIAMLNSVKTLYFTVPVSANDVIICRSNGQQMIVKDHLQKL